MQLVEAVLTTLYPIIHGLSTTLRTVILSFIAIVAAVKFGDWLGADDQS